VRDPDDATTALVTIDERGGGMRRHAFSTDSAIIGTTLTVDAGNGKALLKAAPDVAQSGARVRLRTTRRRGWNQV